MKTLTAPATVLVKYSARQATGRRQRFDKFYTHGYIENYFPYVCASGRWVAAIKATLKDGRTFRYSVGFFSTPLDCDFFCWQYSFHVSANGYVGFYGEWYNAIGRGLASDKVPDADWAGWLASH